MTSKSKQDIVIRGAKTNNLKNISLSIPHNKLIVVTGVSGSGKSSLVFDIIAQEGQRRYFETLPSFARQFLGKLNRPDVDEIEGLSPVISIGQSTAGLNTRSTVGTISDIYDLLRLLYARLGKTDRKIELSRALFSFNSEIGKCKRCNGIGKQEQIDLKKLIALPEKTIREGALAPTLPTGYIMYSQVTIDVLNQVCEAEGFNVDIPWNKLTESQRQVILHGSDKIKVPFGKHSLESRLKWTGIKAKPREEGFYKGMIPIMSDILRRDRNANILRYVHSVTCEDCNGARLNVDGRSVKVREKSIADVVSFELNELKRWLESGSWDSIGQEIIQKITAKVDLLEDLGLGHLTIDRSAKSLSPSEIQRIRVANQILVPLSDVLYVFDEPSIGLHPEENERLLFHFKNLVDRGNTVLVVEHDIETISNADHIIEIGPRAGVEGGELVYNGSFSEFIQRKDLLDISPTLRAILEERDRNKSSKESSGKAIKLFGCKERNLKGIDVGFKLGQVNIVSGRSGSGKSSLVKSTLLRALQQQLGIDTEGELKVSKHENLDLIKKLIFIDHSPIGRTPRSNPATYLGLSDYIRDVFAKTSEAKARKFTKSRFSFNNKGGRCETCQGAGKTQIGMHFLGNVDLVCSTCNGDRFNTETLEVRYRNLSIADVYKLSINDAINLFEEEKKVLSGLKILQEIGLGYLTLGQSSTTLSGGEAQRIKIANQLQKRDTGDTLYIIAEPSIGLHQNDIDSLLQLFGRIRNNGNTIVCIEQDETIIGWSDWHIELGPKSGKLGGELAYQGVPNLIRKGSGNKREESERVSNYKNEIVLSGVTTYTLKNIDVRIPKNKLTVVTGLSGSGKSSLVYDTLFAESNAQFIESLSTYNRSFIQQNSSAELKSFAGLGPAIGISRKGGAASKRSTVGTLLGVYSSLRLLYSRIAQAEGEVFTAQHFSFNNHLGACPVCEGMGVKLTCNPDEIIVYPENSILDGAFSENKSLRYYADLNGQFIATLKEVAVNKNWDLDRPWNQLDKNVQDAILYGTGDQLWDVSWEYSTKSRSGTQALQAKWLGFCNYINDEYQRKLHNKNIKSLEDLQHEVVCETCKGSRLKPELLKTKFLGKNISEFTQMSIVDCLELIARNEETDSLVKAVSKVVLLGVSQTLETVKNLGLGYLSMNRPIKTLSGGERQRVTLAGQLSTHLFGVTYVLDEPTIGLDKEQVKVLIKALNRIIENGNTVVVVEHDPFFIQNSDYLIELGPGAGQLGGQLIFQGDIESIGDTPSSVTSKLILSKQSSFTKRNRERGEEFGVKGAFANNLRNIDVSFYSGQITAVTGVSGSGKSSLMKDTLYKSWLKGGPAGCEKYFGLNQFEEIVLIEQEILSQSRSSTLVSYTGILEDIKTLFWKTEKAKELGFKKGDFSYLSKNGKCSSCGGQGELKTSMDFMSDIWLMCDACKGTRYNNDILNVKYNDYSIADILNLTVNETIELFRKESMVASLNVLAQVGVGHLKLGQSGITFSGGEAQRLKLATSLIKKRKGKTLYLFDEPSTGLHYFDILKLTEVFDSIIERGDTLIFIEHNSELIEYADQEIKLGPGSGNDGGKICN